MKAKSIFKLFLFPISLISISVLPLNLFNLISPTAVHATNWNKYNIAFKNGLRHLNRGNYQKALDFYNEAIGIYNKDPGAYYNRALANQELGNHLEAVDDFKKSMTMDGKMYKANTHYNIGWSYSELEDYDNALIHFNKAIEIKPKEGYFYADKGDTLYELGKEEEACSNYLKSFELGYEEIKDYLNSSDGEWCK